MTSTTGRDSDKFMLRLPEGMRERLKDLAKENNRSLNAQIVYMLQFAIEETEIAAGAYGSEKPSKKAFLRNEVRKAKSILEHILSDYEKELLDDGGGEDADRKKR
ncbi:Arc family DNA-binding protein [Sinorhizobium meliloti]|uniref:Arc family DNA-binding protein n=1 Tax=Rhizobium meliloti TaxID=382 RepID=UPI00067F725F|nr:Arc family DNA-binding protein [Sinorhizobium meliloti]